MSWQGFAAIVREAIELRFEDTTYRLIACQDDGEPLISAEGKLYCYFCGRTYEG